jgi:hypothetical protein
MTMTCMRRKQLERSGIPYSSVTTGVVWRSCRRGRLNFRRSSPFVVSTNGRAGKVLGQAERNTLSGEPGRG